MMAIESVSSMEVIGHAPRSRSPVVVAPARDKMIGRYQKRFQIGQAHSRNGGPWAEQVHPAAVEVIQAVIAAHAKLLAIVVQCDFDLAYGLSLREQTLDRVRGACR